MRLLGGTAIGLSLLAPAALAGCLDFDLTAPSTAPAPANDSAWPRIPNERFPKWLKLGVDLRGRLEAEDGFKFVQGPDDTFYLHRLRLNLAIEPRPWMRIYIEGQDARVAGYNRPVPANAADSMDLHVAYIQFGRVEEKSWGLRAGRQELRFGEGRMVGSSNWSNVGRTYDALRLTYKNKGAQLDWFASSVVKTRDGQFNRPGLRDGFYGFYSSFKKLLPNSVVEPYLLWKLSSQAHSETGRPGHESVYAPGIRAAGKLPKNFDYSVELVVETGHYAQDSIRAWAGHWLLGWRPAPAARNPRVFVAFNYASGDGNGADGRHGTFDPMYPTNHALYGVADRNTWRNLNDLVAGFEFRPAKKWRAELDGHSFWLATRQDGIYNESGTLLVRDRTATSSSIGSEFDLRVFYQPSDRLAVEFGYAHLFAGAFLRQSTMERGATHPYVMWSYRL
jgi:hypothetical protein